MQLLRCNSTHFSAVIMPYGILLVRTLGLGLLHLAEGGSGRVSVSYFICSSQSPIKVAINLLASCARTTRMAGNSNHPPERIRDPRTDTGAQEGVWDVAYPAVLRGVARHGSGGKAPEAE